MSTSVLMEFGLYEGERLITPADFARVIALDLDGGFYRASVQLQDFEHPHYRWDLGIEGMAQSAGKEMLRGLAPGSFVPPESELVTLDGWAGVRLELIGNGYLIGRRPALVYLRPWVVPTVVPIGYAWTEESAQMRDGQHRRFKAIPFTLTMRVMS